MTSYHNVPTLNRRFLLSGASCVEGYKVMIKLIFPRFTISPWSPIESWYDWKIAVEILELWMVKSRIFFFSGIKEKSFYIQHFSYNMSRVHDNTVFEIVEKYLTLLFKCHFRAWFYNVLFCSYRRCVTLRFCTEVMRHTGTGTWCATVINHPPSCTKS